MSRKAADRVSFPFPGEVFTEIEAILLLTGARAELVAAGGVGGAEGCVWLAVWGNKEQMEAAENVVKEVANEPGFDSLNENSQFT